LIRREDFSGYSTGDSESPGELEHFILHSQGETVILSKIEKNEP
jgi:hypothetical protein